MAITIWGDYKLSNPQSKIYASELNVYPNPSEGIITLSTENANINTLQYELVDPVGRKVIAPRQSTTATSITLDLATNPADFYFFRLVQDNNVKTFKIIKN